MNKHKKWLNYSGFTIFIAILLIIILNYKIDSLGIFGNSSFMEKAAIAITDGNMVSGLKNIDNRLFQLQIINHLHTKTDAVTLGSSRSMKIRKKFISNPNKNYFNHSVAGASLEDFIAIIGIYKKNLNYIPNKIIINIDPWIFNINNEQTRYKALSEYYNYMIYELNVTTNYLLPSKIDSNKWKQLINYEYTINNINFFRNYVKKNMNAFYILKPNDKNRYGIDKDGTAYDNNANYDIDRVNRKAISYTQGDVYSMNAFKNINSELFEVFIHYLQNNNKEIVFFLHPYHPTTYNILIQDDRYKIMGDIEKYITYFAKRNSIKLFGSYNPAKYNFKDTDFHDGMHSLEIVPKTILLEYKNIPK